MSNLAFDALGTRWEIVTRRKLCVRIRVRLLDRVEAFDAVFSRFRSDSLVSEAAMAPEGGRFRFPDEAQALFGLYDRLHAATRGALDPLVGRDVELLGYDARYSLHPVPLHERSAAHAGSRAVWTRDAERKGATITTRRPVVIDVGAAGKGYLVDLLCGILRDEGLDEFVVDAGGDLRHAGGRPLRAGLEHPHDPTRVVGVCHVQNQALCASSTTRRRWGEGLHHVLDARTGQPVNDVVATWVMADTAALADGLATALFFTGGSELERSFSFSWVRMLAGGRVEASRSFEGELFVATPPHRLRVARTALGLLVASSLALVPCAAGAERLGGAANVADANVESAASAASSFGDGTYDATGWYGGQPSSIGVRIALDRGVITSVRVTPHATNPTSLDFQKRFADAVSAVVVGKRIDQVKVDRLAGSSGTPKGFNDALERIKHAARKNARNGQARERIQAR